MPDTAVQRAPISRTEIQQKVTGIIAETFAIPCTWFSGTTEIRLIGVRMDGTGTPRSLTAVAVVVELVERAFGVTLDDARSNLWRVTATVGELISLVEGALSQGGIA